MSPKEEWITDVVLPTEDLSGYDPVLPTEAVYEPGICLFRVLGAQLGGKGKGKPLTIGFQIVDGPGDKHTNKDRRLRKTLNLEQEFCLRVLRGICERLGGKDGLVRGQPNMKAIAGVEFKARLFERDYVDKNGANKKGYEIDFESMELTKRGKAAAQAAQSEAPSD